MAYLVNDQTGETIDLPEGESTVGRGPLLKITDKRVSRNHALLQLEGGKLKLCPKHKNPCFYKAVDKAAFSILPTDIWQALGHGDVFKLLPDTLIFRVVEKDTVKSGGGSGGSLTGAAESNGKPKTSAPKNDAVDLMDQLFCDPTSITAASAPPAKDSKPSSSTGEKIERTVGSKPAKKDTAECGVSRSPKKDDLDMESGDSSSVKSETVIKEKASKDNAKSDMKAGSTNKPRKLPDWLSGITNTSSVSEKKVTASRKRKSPAAKTSSAAVAKKKKKTSEDGDSDTLPSPPPTKKRAVAKDTVIADSSTSSSVDRPASKKEPTKTDTPTTAVAAKTTKPVSKEKEKEKDKKKPLCPYGTKCYRKNPAHFKEYSHDFSSADSADVDEDDASDDDDDKPVCPYGADCYRKNPVHRREYRHPGPPVSTSKTSGKRRSGRKTAGHRSVVVGDSDDDGEANTYDYNDSFIDDDQGESSSYGGDSEDSDWAPPPVAPERGAEVEEEDDIDELLSEAKDFIANEKMRKR